MCLNSMLKSMKWNFETIINYKMTVIDYDWMSDWQYVVRQREKLLINVVLKTDIVNWNWFNSFCIIIIIIIEWKWRYREWKCVIWWDWWWYRGWNYWRYASSYCSNYNMSYYYDWVILSKHHLALFKLQSITSGFIILRYILLGAALFANWEKWDLLDGSYFCFISLSSIGFGDIVPGSAVSKHNSCWRLTKTTNKQTTVYVGIF